MSMLQSTLIYSIQQVITSTVKDKILCQGLTMIDRNQCMLCWSLSTLLTGCDVQKCLKPEEVEFLLATKHKPNIVMDTISTIIKAGKLTNQEIFNMDQNLTLFSDTTGGSERIFKTPIPLSWTSEQSLLEFVIWPSFLFSQALDYWKFESCY